jgi:hypothetical protein
MDSSAGCSEYENYPDCFVVCPKAGLRVRLEDFPYVANSDVQINPSPDLEIFQKE